MDHQKGSDNRTNKPPKKNATRRHPVCRQGVLEELNLEPPVLLVDGYNMCGYWPKLKKHFAKGDLEAARAKLVVELQTYGACKGELQNAKAFRNSGASLMLGFWSCCLKHYHELEVVMELQTYRACKAEIR